MRTRLLPASLLCIIAGCGPDIEGEFAARIDESDVIFHVGCPERSGFSAAPCNDGRRLCGDVVDEAAVALADGPIVVELLIDNVESSSLLTWFIETAGSGDLYAEQGTDFPLECLWVSCGVTKTTFPAGDLVDGNGALVLRPEPAAAGLDADVSDTCE